MSDDNVKNLIPLTERNKEEAKEIRSKGGRASGAVRRRKKNIRKTMEALIGTEIPMNQKKIRAILAGMGIEENDMTFDTALCGALLMKALNGNVRAAELIINMLGHTASQELAEKEFAHKKKIGKQKMENFDSTLADPSELIEVLKRDD